MQSAHINAIQSQPLQRSRSSIKRYIDSLPRSPTTTNQDGTTEVGSLTTVFVEPSFWANLRLLCPESTTLFTDQSGSYLQVKRSDGSHVKFYSK